MTAVSFSLVNLARSDEFDINEIPCFQRLLLPDHIVHYDIRTCSVCDSNDPGSHVTSIYQVRLE